MFRYLTTRLVSLTPTLLFISIIIFTLLRFVPGDPIDVMYGTDVPDEIARAAIEKKLGLDQPVWVQYGKWLGRIVTGDLGYSYRSRLSVTFLIWQRLLASVLLLGASICLAVIIAIPFGIIAALRHDTIVDVGLMAVAMVALSVPPFVSGLGLVLVFGVYLGWFPTMGYSVANPLSLLHHLTLPAITLAAAILGIIQRLMRSTVLEVLNQDYVRTAYAKGLRERGVLLRHILKNALLPVVTLIGLQASYLVGGTVIVEIVFAWPGLGGLIVDAILGRDYPVVQGTVLLVAIAVVLINLVVDLTYGFLDPRVRMA